MSNIITATNFTKTLPILTSHSKACTLKDKNEVKVIDELRAIGVSHTVFYSPDQGKHKEESTSTTEQYGGMKLAVLKGFSAAEIALVATKETMKTATILHKDMQITHPTGSDKAAAKRVVLNDVGARMGDLARLLKPKAKRAPQTPTPTPTGDSQTAKDDMAPAKQVGVTKEVELLNRIVKISQDKVEPEYDIVELGKLLAKALQVINTPFEPKH